MTSFPIHGSVVALVTPMREDTSIDYESLERLIEMHVGNYTDAILVAGTTAEPSTLSWDEHIQVVRHVVRCVRGRLPVIAGTGANSTSEAVELTQAAKRAGADACLLVTPYYNRPTQEGLYLHHRTVANAVAIPQIVYNVPRRTGCDLLPDTVERLARVPNIAAVKEATGDVERAREILARCGDVIDLFSGDDIVGLDLMLMGAKGVISVTANVAPKTMHDMCAAAINGNVQRARELNAKLDGLHQGLFVESNPIPVKWALNQMGVIPPGIRLPLTPLSPVHQDVVRQALRGAEISLG